MVYIPIPVTERLSLPRNRVVRLTDCCYITEILLLQRETPTQTNQKQEFRGHKKILPGMIMRFDENNVFLT